MIDFADRLNNQALSPYGTPQSVCLPRVEHRRTRLGCPEKANYRGVQLIRTMKIAKKPSELAESSELLAPCG